MTLLILVGLDSNVLTGRETEFSYFFRHAKRKKRKHNRTS